MNTQDIINTDWLAKEEATFQSKTNQTFEQLPSLKLVPDMITELDVDFSKPFAKWTDDSDQKKIIIKAIVPVIVNGSKMNWWLNIRNPVYAEIVRAGRNGQTHFRILQTGTQKSTRYSLLK